MSGKGRKPALGFEEAEAKLREELKKEGFGVLTEINLGETLKKKLDVDYGNYVILGACNPPFAYRALQAEREIGLMLPCNAIVYEAGEKEGGGTFVSAILPTRAMGMIDNPELLKVAGEIEEKLARVINNM